MYGDTVMCAASVLGDSSAARPPVFVSAVARGYRLLPGLPDFPRRSLRPDHYDFHGVAARFMVPRFVENLLAEIPSVSMEEASEEEVVSKIQQIFLNTDNEYLQEKEESLKRRHSYGKLKMDEPDFVEDDGCDLSVLLILVGPFIHRGKFIQTRKAYLIHFQIDLLLRIRIFSSMLGWEMYSPCACEQTPVPAGWECQRRLRKAAPVQVGVAS
jgi:hypothetical protein